MKQGIQPKEVTSRGGWNASSQQMAAAVAAQEALKNGADEKGMLTAAKDAATKVAVDEAAQAVTRRYLLALTNRANMVGRYNELSTVELLDIVLSTSVEGGSLTFEQYREQLALTEQNGK